MKNEPVAWMSIQEGIFSPSFKYLFSETKKQGFIPLYTHPHSAESVKVKELTDEDIAKVVHELNKKANTPERWVTAMQIGAETIIQLRDELAILRKAHSNCNGFCGEYECKENQAGCKRNPTHSSDCGCERVMHECSEKDNCRMLTILRKAQENG